MTREDVMAWVAGYERAWRASDAGAVPRLFTEDAAYRRSPFEPPEVGHAAIAALWAEDQGERFTVDARPVAVDGANAVVRLDVHYLGDEPRHYQDLWVLRFAADGRVADFEEWPFFPGRPYTASDG